MAEARGRAQRRYVREKATIDHLVRYADLMRGCGDQDGLVAWAKIWRMIAVMHPTPTGLPH